MITFKEFLLTEGERSPSVSLDDAIKLIEKHCHSFADKMTSSKVTLFRGVERSTELAYVGDSAKGRERTSANTQNYFTWWHDNNPEWAKYPKRSRSFIGSSNPLVAEGYGECYIMVPYDDANIAVMPEPDLFLSFNLDPDRKIPNNYKSAKGNSGNLKNFNSSINTIIASNGLDTIQSYEDMIKVFKEITVPVVENTPWKNEDEKKVMLNHFKSAGAKDMVDVWEYLFDPKSVEQFTAGNADLSVVKNNEVYVEGKAVFLNTTQRDSFNYAKSMGWNLRGSK